MIRSVYTNQSTSNIQPNAAKIKRICPHPVLPWAAFVERKSGSQESYASKVLVWDYSKNMSIFSISTDEISRRCSHLTSKKNSGNRSVGFFSLGDDESTIDNNVPKTPPSSKVKYSTTSTNSYTNSADDASAFDQTSHSSNSMKTKKLPVSSVQSVLQQSRKSETPKYGHHIIQVHFFDSHTLFWDMGISSDLVDESQPSLEEKKLSSTSCWLIIIFSSYNAILINIVTGECRLVDNSSSVSAVEPLTSSLMVLGYNDGELKFYDWQKGTKLGAEKAHTREVVGIIPATCSQYHGISQHTSITGARFISVGADSDAFLWECDILTNELTSLQRVKSSCVVKMENVSAKDASFDAQRGLFITMHAGLQHVLVFDLLSIAFNGQTLVLEPCLKLLVPGLGIGSVILSVIHPAYSDTTLAIWVLNKTTPEISLLVAPISSQDEQTRPEEHATHFIPDMLDEALSKLKIYTIQIPRFRNNIVLCGTNIGLLVIDVSPVKKVKSSRHVAINASGDEFLVVEGDSVFRTSLHISGLNPVGPLVMRNPTIVYRTVASPNSYKIRCPPQLLLSPSKRYICFFWSSERRYEILHIPTLLQSSQGFPPPVDFGSNTLDFSWVGCDNTYAIMCSNETIPHGKSKRFELKGGIKSLKSKVSNFGKSNDDGNRSSVSGNNKNVLNLKILIESKMNGMTANISSQAAATPKNLGELNVRGGHPWCLFSGPLLCVGCIPIHSNEKSDGVAYFYSRRISDEILKASSYVTVGPALPIPDLIEWNEDGSLCCICVGKSVYIYESKQPDFKLISRVSLAPNEVGGSVHSAKFIHNVLFCTTHGTIQCIFTRKSDIYDGKPKSSDSFVLSSYICSESSQSTNDNLSFIPRVEKACLNHPSILNILGGSLLVSTVTGFRAVSLAHPIIRIGILISAGQVERAKSWFGSFNIRYHENLSRFLIKLGHPNIAVTLEGLSLESRIEICLKYKLSGPLEKIIQDFGAVNIKQADRGEGIYNTVECVGAYLLARGQGELVRRMASECIMVNDGTKRDAFLLASMLLATNQSDARRLLKRIVGSKDRPNIGWGGDAGQFVREFVMK